MLCTWICWEDRGGNISHSLTIVGLLSSNLNTYKCNINCIFSQFFLRCSTCLSMYVYPYLFVIYNRFFLFLFYYILTFSSTQCYSFYAEFPYLPRKLFSSTSIDNHMSQTFLSNSDKSKKQLMLTYSRRIKTLLNYTGIRKNTTHGAGRARVSAGWWMWPILCRARKSPVAEPLWSGLLFSCVTQLQ